VLVTVVAALSLALASWLWTPDIDRARLEARYLAKPADMIDVGDWRLHVRDDGLRDAPAVVLIHGFGSSLQTWDGWVSGLARAHRVIRFDLPGNGLSPPDPAGTYTDDRSIELLIALMDRMDIRRATVVGHSIGGRIAWTFAARHPMRVDRLVLVAPDGFASPGFGYGKAPEVPALFGIMRYVLPKPLLRMNLEPAYADSRHVAPALVDRYHDLIRAPGARQAMLDRLRQTVLTEPVPILSTIPAPTLLLWGERDALIPFANAADYLAALPDARLASFPTAGHLPQEEAATESLGALLGFLGR
jgi:pimeloyl-ACP methyl ester carboxylesterase